MEQMKIGRVEPDGKVRVAFEGEPWLIAKEGEATPGSWVRFREVGEKAVLDGPALAAPESALADLYVLAARRDLSPLHSPKAMDEAAAVLERPGIDDPSLVDLTHLPFVTIDEPHSQDLDQALFIEQRGAGTTVWYAIADPAWSVRPGTALFEEALERGSTYYLPGLVLPMLPSELSEDIVSLNPNVDRRAMAFEVALDAAGRVEQTQIHRARVRSRVKTSYGAVQEYYDGDRPAPGTDLPEIGSQIVKSLELLREVGSLRLELAESRDVVALRRQEIAVSLAGKEGLRFVAMTDPRHEVERYNEQISLLCNTEGARFLLRGDTDDDKVDPVFRVHDPPAIERLDELGRHLRTLVRLRGLDADRWGWRRGQRSLASYLRDLPMNGPEARIARSVHRQVMLTGGRSLFASAPGMHYGVGAEVYGRFTAPMREVVGIFTHKEAWEKLGLAPASADPELREKVIEVANEAKQTQRKLDREVNRKVLDQLFGDDLANSREARPVRLGTVMGISRSKVHVTLDDPPIDVKVYLHHLTRQIPGRIAQGRDQMTLRNLSDRRTLQTVGDAVRVRALGHDPKRDRWDLELLPTNRV